VRPRVVADGWYSWIAPGFMPLTRLLERWPERLRALVLGTGPARGLILAAASGRYERVAAIREAPGWRTLLLVRALAGRRRKLVVLQFIDHGPAGRLWPAIERWALRRALLVAQVLSDVELAAYPARFDLSAERFALIRFAWRRSPAGAPPPPPAGARQGILAVGRAYCDWPTLMAAADRRGWDLTVVCAENDRAALESLDTLHGAGARIHADLPHDQVQALMVAAAVCVICVHEGVAARGHVRLCDATEAGAALVASHVPSLEGYVDPGETALLVAPGDAGALRGAVERLAADPDLRSRLGRAAFARAEAWTGPDYVAALEELAWRGAVGGS
jgi:glycosyltransferase involved in cell wall biosynthesis